METKEELFTKLDKYCKAVPLVEEAKEEYELELNRCKNAVPDGVHKTRFFHYFWPFVVFFFAVWVIAFIFTAIFGDYGNNIVFIVILAFLQIMVPVIGVGYSWKRRDRQHRQVDEQIEEYRKKALESDSLKKLDMKVREKQARANELAQFLPAKYRTLKGAAMIRKYLYKDDINTIEEAVSRIEGRE